MSSQNLEADVLGIPRLKWLAGTMVVSTLLHGAAFASLGKAGLFRDERRPPSEVDFVTTPLPPEPPRDTPQPEPPPATPEPRITTQKAATRDTPPPEPAAQPLDLRGVTLTNDSGGFAMPTGNGLALDRPIGTSRAPVLTPPPTVAPPPAAPVAPAIVAFESLGARPSPPALEGALARNYPADARRRAIGGSAKVRARIEPDGVARSVSVEGETFAGFGEACRRTVAGSHWSPPRDSNGRAVATQVRYTCHFKVEP
jgi:TonB family protein